MRREQYHHNIAAKSAPAAAAAIAMPIIVPVVQPLDFATRDGGLVDAEVAPVEVAPVAADIALDNIVVVEADMTVE